MQKALGRVRGLTKSRKNAVEPPSAIQNDLGEKAIGGDLAGVKLSLANGANPSFLSYDEKETLLHRVCYCSNRDVSEIDYASICELILDRGIEVDAVNDRGETALHIAARTDAESVARALLLRGATLEAETSSGHTAYLVAASRDRQRMRAFLANAAVEKFRVSRLSDACMDNYVTCLHRAVVRGDVKFVRELLSSGTNVDWKDTSCGQRAIHACCAAILASCEDFDSLEEAASSTDEPDPENGKDLATRMAACKAFGNIASTSNQDRRAKLFGVLQCLVEFGADVNAAIELLHAPGANQLRNGSLSDQHAYAALLPWIGHGSRALHILALSDLTQKEASFLVAKGATLTLPDAEARIPYIVARKAARRAMAHCMTSLRYPNEAVLEQVRCRPFDRKRHGAVKDCLQADLANAIQSGERSAVLLSLLNGADVVEPALGIGHTALHVLAEASPSFPSAEDVDAVFSLLMRWGAKSSLGTKNAAGDTVLHVCARVGATQLATHLLYALKKAPTLDVVNEAHRTPYLVARHHRQRAMARLLSKARIDHLGKSKLKPVDRKSAPELKNNMQADLSRAIEECSVSMVAEALANGADASEADELRRGDTPVHECIRLLDKRHTIERRAGDAAVDERAFEATVISVLELLLDHGAPTDASNTEGDAPIHVAVQVNSFAAVKSLLVFGANLDAEDAKGRMAYLLADNEGNRDMATYLSEERKKSDKAIRRRPTYTIPWPKSNVRASLSEQDLEEMEVSSPVDATEEGGVQKSSPDSESSTSGSARLRHESEPKGTVLPAATARRSVIPAPPGHGPPPDPPPSVKDPQPPLSRPKLPSAPAPRGANAAVGALATDAANSKQALTYQAERSGPAGEDASDSAQMSSQVESQPSHGIDDGASSPASTLQAVRTEHGGTFPPPAPSTKASGGPPRRPPPGPVPPASTAPIIDAHTESISSPSAEEKSTASSSSIQHVSLSEEKSKPKPKPKSAPPPPPKPARLDSPDARRCPTKSAPVQNNGGSASPSVPAPRRPPPPPPPPAEEADSENKFGTRAQSVTTVEELEREMQAVRATREREDEELAALIRSIELRRRREDAAFAERRRALEAMQRTE